MDINIPKDVSHALSDIGYNSIYLTDKFPAHADDKDILQWVEKQKGFVITRDQNFSENGSTRPITVYGDSTQGMIRQAVMGLLSREVYPSAMDI